jgi:hypothetical protein
LKSVFREISRDSGSLYIAPLNLISQDVFNKLC